MVRIWIQILFQYKSTNLKTVKCDAANNGEQKRNIANELLPLPLIRLSDEDGGTAKMNWIYRYCV